MAYSAASQGLLLNDGATPRTPVSFKPLPALNNPALWYQHKEPRQQAVIEEVKPMLELYYFPTATSGYKARLPLAEKGVECAHRVLDRDAGDLLTPGISGAEPECGRANTRA